MTTAFVLVQTQPPGQGVRNGSELPSQDRLERPVSGDELETPAVAARPQAAIRKMSRIAAAREVRYAFRPDAGRSPSEATKVARSFSCRLTLHGKKFTYENKVLRGMLFRMPMLSGDFTSHNKLGA